MGGIGKEVLSGKGQSVRPTAVIADDDALARERLKDLVTEAPLVELVGEAADGESAARLIDELRPDIAFLDIEMPVWSGIEVLRRVHHTPVVIFTTAYDQYAVTAFELAAVDYLLKPFGVARFREAVERAVRMVGEGPTPEGTGEPVVERGAEGGAMRGRVEEALGDEKPLTRLFLAERDTIVPVSVEEVLRFEADGDYVIVYTAERQHLVRLRLQSLEARLGERFLRVHRSHLVNLDHVRQFERHEDGRLIVIMSDQTRILASRSRSRELRRRAR